MGIVNFALPGLPSPQRPGDNGSDVENIPPGKEDIPDNSLVGHLKEVVGKDDVDPQEQVELLHTSSSSSSFTTTSATMGDGRQPPSIGGSKADLCPDTITFEQSGPWRNRTRLEKSLVVLVVLFFVAAASFLALFLLVHFRSQSPESPTDVCTSAECLETAAYISKSLDPSAKPCDDFYQFACGGWIKEHPIPSTMSTYSNFQVILKDLQETMRDLLTDNDPNALDGITKARTFFKSCEDTDAIDAQGTAPLRELLASGGSDLFPTLNPNWVDEGLDLSTILERVGQVGNLGSSPIITIGVSGDQKQSENNIIYFTQTSHHLPSRQLYLGNRSQPLLLKYQQLYVDVLVYLGADPTTAQRDAVLLIDFEILVANATEPPELRRNSEALYNKMTVQNVTDRYPTFDWLGHLQRQFGSANVSVGPDEEVVVFALTYYDNIFPVVNTASRRTLMNYCMWRLVYPLLGLLNKPLRDLKQRFSRALSGAPRRPERWKDCVSTTDSKFPDAAGRLYVDARFSLHAKERVEGMITDLIATFKEMVLELDWMSDTTKKAALEKADAIVPKIGYPEEIMNDTYLNEKTGKLDLKDDSYFNNHVEVFMQQRLHNLRKVREPVDRNAWHISAATVNAFYNKMTNEITFPAGILHRPFFSDKYFDAMNYGGIGFVIGHEITHGFDDSGRGFDKTGNLHPWWTPDDLSRFRGRVQNMVDQYSNYTEPTLGIKLNGRLTIGEDVADNGGLKEAYRAYRKLISKRGYEEPNLPVIGYTPDQLFFISAAQAWCGNQRDQVKLIFLQSDYHSPMRFRVIGPMQNNADFSRVFNCPAGSYMNPLKKINVW